MEALAKEEAEKARKKAEKKAAKEAAIAQRLNEEREAAEKLKRRSKEFDSKMTAQDFKTLLDVGEAPDQELLKQQKEIAQKKNNELQ